MVRSISYFESFVMSLKISTKTFQDVFFQWSSAQAFWSTAIQYSLLTLLKSKVYSSLPYQEKIMVMEAVFTFFIQGIIILPCN